MYNIPYFKANNDAEVLAFMKAHPFITLCGVDENGSPVATHIPVLFAEKEGKLWLRAHIMRKQDHTIAFEKNNQVLAIFHGPHTYVSAKHYSPQNVASTWNYKAVHVKGILHFLNDNELWQVLHDLTTHFENDHDSPASMKYLSSDYVTSMMKAIVAFEIEIIDIQHVFKMSQNKNEETQKSIIDSLEKGNEEDKAVAAEMKANHL
ncbi:MAG: FMN-binding negative transcriptional regulator [Chitinophagaceae bacterium]|nr:FMN-binding negative transcriptional regulator [Chitinophagaceae bacterium]